MKLHWQVLIGIVLGVVAGLVIQMTLEAPAWSGATWRDADGGIELVEAVGPARESKLERGVLVDALIADRGSPQQRLIELETPADFDAAVAQAAIGDIVWLRAPRLEEPLPLTFAMDPASTRAKVLAPVDFVAEIFMTLLKMLIVPLVMSSIMAGVAGVGTLKDLRRLGGKTFLYYITTSLLAILVGQVLVNLVQPGKDATLGLSPLRGGGEMPDASFVDVLKRMIPENIVESMADNSAMLSMIFFALLFGYSIARSGEPHRGQMTSFVESVFRVMLRMAEIVLALLPYGVFALMLRVVAKTGFGVFAPLLVYMGTVLAALLIHACVTLPIILRVVGGISPRRWFKAMSPAIMTAFSTSSSSMTLPVTLETVEVRGRVSNKITSFTLPLGATINMDGTALYECIGVIFLAQYYGSTGGDFDLTFGKQVMIVVMALLASIGAAGIPSAGLVMMLTILAALELPAEGAALLLAVDRPLDMLRTVVNVWSDSCGAAVISRSEGEEGPLFAGAPG